MAKSNFMSGITRGLHRVGFELKKHSPEILLVAGIAGAVGSAILACKATTKLHGVLEETKKNVDAIHYATEHPEELPAEYTAEDGKKDLAIVYAQTGLKLVKLYGPSVVLGALSVGSILASHNLLNKRYIATAAAYATVDNNFKEYRGRVIERFGKDLDRELKYNIKTKEIEETVVDENGKETKVKKTVEVVDSNTVPEYSSYARFFAEGQEGWDKNPEFTLMFLHQQQEWANQKLRSQGWLFLNDVYEMLDIPKTQAGQVVGWVYKKDSESDGYVDFGIFNQDSPRAIAFVNGHERNILLDFNVDGVVWDILR